MRGGNWWRRGQLGPVAAAGILLRKLVAGLLSLLLLSPYYTYLVERYWYSAARCNACML